MNIDAIIETALAVGKTYAEGLNEKEAKDDAEPINLELRCIGSRLHWDNFMFAVFYQNKEGSYYYFQCDRTENLTVEKNWSFVFQRTSFNQSEFDEIIWSLPN